MTLFESLQNVCLPHTFHLRFSFPLWPPWRFYNSLWLLNEMHNRFQYDSIHYEWLIFVCLSPPKLRSRVIKSYNFKYYLTASKQNGFLTSQQNICHSLLTNNCYLADWQNGHSSMIGREMKRKILVSDLFRFYSFYKKLERNFHHIKWLYFLREKQTMIFLSWANHERDHCPADILMLFPVTVERLAALQLTEGSCWRYFSQKEKNCPPPLQFVTMWLH